MTPAGIAQLRAEEGLRLHAYPDPESELAKTGKGSGDPWTCGYGSTGPDIGPETVWTQAVAETRNLKDIAHAEALLDAHLPWWRGLDPVRADCVADLCFNMGIGNAMHGLLSFQHTLEAIRLGLYGAAAEGLLASKWCGEVKTRATRLAQELRTGVRAA